MPAPPSATEPGIPARSEGGFAGSLLAFAEDLREEGVAVGTSEILDAFAALEHVSWTSQADFRETLAATIAKSQDDRRVALPFGTKGQRRNRERESRGRQIEKSLRHHRANSDNQVGSRDQSDGAESGAPEHHWIFAPP